MGLDCSDESVLDCIALCMGYIGEFNKVRYIDKKCGMLKSEVWYTKVWPFGNLPLYLTSGRVKV